MQILLIEDNEGDIALFREALLIKKIKVDLKVVKDGEKAINYLKSINDEGPEDLVDIIIIDINLPKISGKEILAYISGCANMDLIPRIFLSTSNLGVDIDYCYQNSGDCFLTKPNDVFEFFDLVGKICEFWGQSKVRESKCFDLNKKTYSKVH